MRTLALLGGMTHSATTLYYTTLNTLIHRHLGGATSAPLLIQSFNHAEMQRLFGSHAWDAVTQKFLTSARHLHNAGAEGLMICCNIGHKVFDDVERELAREGLGVQCLHILDPTGQAIRDRGIKRVGLLGTRQVMEDGFFRERLAEKFGVETVVPDEGTREGIQKMIFEELGAGVFHDGQKRLLRRGIEQCKGQGAEGVVFACTELGFVLKREEVEVDGGMVMWDTLEGHAAWGAEWILEGVVEAKRGGGS